MITIEIADNGYIVRGPHPNAEGDLVAVFPFDDERDNVRDGQPQANRQLIGALLEYWLFEGGRYSDGRCYVEVRPGDKWEAGGR